RATPRHEWDANVRRDIRCPERRPKPGILGIAAARGERVAIGPLRATRAPYTGRRVLVPRLGTAAPHERCRYGDGGTGAGAGDAGCGRRGPPERGPQRQARAVSPVRIVPFGRRVWKPTIRRIRRGTPAPPRPTSGSRCR